MTTGISISLQKDLLGWRFYLWPKVDHYRYWSSGSIVSAYQYFNYERTWWRLFQKRVMRS